MDLLNQIVTGSNSTTRLQQQVGRILNQIPPEVIQQVLQQPIPTKQSLSILQDVATDTTTNSPLNMLLHLFPLKHEQKEIAKLVIDYIGKEGGIDLKGKEKAIEPLVLQSLLRLFWKNQSGANRIVSQFFLTRLDAFAKQYIQKAIPSLSPLELDSINQLLHQLTGIKSPYQSTLIDKVDRLTKQEHFASTLFTSNNKRLASTFQVPSNDPIFQHLLSALFNANDIHIPFSEILSVMASSDFASGVKNDANIGISVIDRVTGKVEKEQIDWWLIVIFRLLYSPEVLKNVLDLTGDTDVNGLKKIFRSLTVFAGRYYNTPASAKNIKGTIAKYQLNTAEFLQSVSSFRTYNEFFHRKLKPNARPMDPMVSVMSSVITSPADCRVTVFPTVSLARQIWVKGDQFSIRNLVDSEALARPFMEDEDECSIAICRLAPQDYHRYHHFVDGRASSPRLVEGAYLTVNPLAVNSTAFDVFTENKRVVLPVESPIFGSCVAVIIGATMVGSITLTKPKLGELTNQTTTPVKRGEEMGYFSFGGSTIILVFKKDRVTFWPDLLHNSSDETDRGIIETVIKVGQPIAMSANDPFPVDLPFLPSVVPPTREGSPMMDLDDNLEDQADSSTSSYIQRKGKQWLGAAFDN